MYKRTSSFTTLGFVDENLRKRETNIPVDRKYSVIRRVTKVNNFSSRRPCSSKRHWDEDVGYYNVVIPIGQIVSPESQVEVEVIKRDDVSRKVRCLEH